MERCMKPGWESRVVKRQPSLDNILPTFESKLLSHCILFKNGLVTISDCRGSLEIWTAQRTDTELWTGLNIFILRCHSSAGTSATALGPLTCLCSSQPLLATTACSLQSSAAWTPNQPSQHSRFIWVYTIVAIFQ